MSLGKNEERRRGNGIEHRRERCKNTCKVHKLIYAMKKIKRKAY
ncbi:MAG: hypothetical protein U9N35_06080 [Euryarchaeota archaeon]|nr:hypothetical protein [Euryarchaeota archaeon]